MLLSPKRHVYKTYKATLDKKFNSNDIKPLENGVTLDDGYVTLPAKIESYQENIVYISIREGKYHQVKRMFQAFDYNVVELNRESFGPLKLDSSLKLGEYRSLTKEELDLLMKSYENK